VARALSRGNGRFYCPFPLVPLPHELQFARAPVRPHHSGRASAAGRRGLGALVETAARSDDVAIRASVTQRSKVNATRVDGTTALYGDQLPPSLSCSLNKLDRIEPLPNESPSRLGFEICHRRGTSSRDLPVKHCKRTASAPRYTRSLASFAHAGVAQLVVRSGESRV
jgi:hypothetical protein